MPKEPNNTCTSHVVGCSIKMRFGKSSETSHEMMNDVTQEQCLISDTKGLEKEHE